MFKFVDVDQNSDAWFSLRGGKFTMSNAGKVMASYGKAFGEPAKKYAVNIAIERIIGKPVSSNSYQNEHMERGHEQEPIARMLYEDEFFTDVTNGGFFHDDFLGDSPDGLVGDCGGVEIKCVIGSVHFANIKRGTVDPAYKWQIIGHLYCTGRDWFDFVSYCADFPEGKKLYTYRMFARDLKEEFAMMDSRVKEFKALVDSTKKIILESSYLN